MPDATMRNNNMKESKKFMATSDFSMYDPVKKVQVSPKERGNQGPIKLTNDLQNMVKLENMHSTNRTKKRVNHNFTSTSTISPASVMSPKKGTFGGRAGSV